MTRASSGDFLQHRIELLLAARESARGETVGAGVTPEHGPPSAEQITGDANENSTPLAERQTAAPRSVLDPGEKSVADDFDSSNIALARHLRITDSEGSLLRDLAWAAGGSPRRALRLLNVYQLIKASLTDAEVADIEAGGTCRCSARSRSPPGQLTYMRSGQQDGFNLERSVLAGCHCTT